MKRVKVAVLYICIGEYTVFWKGFYKSSQKFFFSDDRNIEIDYYVFTDNSEAVDKAENIHVIYQKSLGWPGNTLKRFHMFFGIRNELSTFDYVFFFNANCVFEDKISATEFLPKKDILVVQHPGFYNMDNTQFTYDRNSKSRAFIPEGEGDYYVAGGVNGGKSRAFLEMAKELKNRIDKDEKDGIVALWHDESHLNKYVYEYNNYTILTPSYCYPEGWNIPYKKKICVLDKSKYIDVDCIKKGRTKMISRIKRRIFSNKGENK